MVSSRRSVGWACEAAGVGAWGRAFQVWGSWFSGGHLRRCGWSVDGSDEHSVSELTTRPRMGEDCWSRGLQSALLLSVLRWVVSHRWLLPGLMDSESLRQQLRTIGLYTHCLGLQRGATWMFWAAPPQARGGGGGCHWGAQARQPSLGESGGRLLAPAVCPLALVMPHPVPNPSGAPSHRSSPGSGG